MKNAISLWMFGLFLLTATAAHGRVPDFADLIENTSPAVVQIGTVQKVSSGQRRLPQGQQIPELFREFFEQQRPRERQARSMGSGLIISGDGYILTNNHVVDGADEISVRLMDRREYTAELVGSDPRSDLALLKIDGEDLPVVEFAEPGDLRVGEWVVAIGAPFGLDYSASVGIVSAIGRSIPTPRGENYVPFIQSDVAINPGNSGGPLFNQDGEVVGINSQIYTRSGGSIGLSFSVPVSVALDVVSQLKEKGHVERGWLGVYIQEMDRDLARSLGLDAPRGALIAQVMPDSPAERSGLKDGDVIVRFNGERIVESGDLPHEVGLMAPGSEAPAVVVRDGRKRKITVEVGALPDEEGQRAPTRTTTDGDRLGLDIQPLDREAATQLEIDGGVVVEQVFPESPAARAGLRPGDVLIQLGNSPVQDPDEYQRVVSDLPEDVPVLVRFLRQGQFIYRTLEIEP